MREYIIRYLQEKGLQFKEANDQFILERCASCFTKGTPVLTSRGVKDIDKICIGDKVLTHTGKFQKVTNVMRRKVNKVHQLDFQGNLLPVINVTENHKFYGGKIQNNKSGDNVWIKSKSKFKYGVRNHYGSFTSEVRPVDKFTEDFYLQVGKVALTDDYFDEYEMWMFGLFLAEGSVGTRSISFSLHEKETEYIKKIHQYFGKTKVVAKKGSKGVQIYIYGKEKIKDFVTLFKGMKSHSKYIPECLMKSKNVKYLLEGLFDGDAYYRKKDTSIIYGTVSKHLAYQVQILANTIGWKVSGTYEDPKLYPGVQSRHRVYRICVRKEGDNKSFRKAAYRGSGYWLKKGNFWKQKVMGNMLKDTYVYNITVEEDHSYVIGNIVVKNCGDASFHHFYMNQEIGTWDCKKCGFSGGFNDFRKMFGDSEIDLTAFKVDKVDFVKPKEYRALHYNLAIEYAERLWNVDTKFKDYLLNKRKLTEDVLKKFKIGSNGKAISIPIYENDVLVNLRYRRDPAQDDNPDAGPRYSQEKGCKPALFNGDVLREPLSTVVITEGEMDAMQLIQRGFNNVVSVTLGAGYFSKEWISKFEGVKVITIIFDSDEAGRAGAKKVAELLGVDRCKIVVLPLKEGRYKTDITQYFVEDGNTKADFVELVKNAKSASSVSEESVKHISEFTDKLRKILLEGSHLGEKTGYDKLDELLGGFRKGRLIVISGKPNSGKTSFALSIASNMALRKLPVFYFSLEMPPIDIVKKLLMIRAFVTSDDLKKVEDPSEVLEKIDKTFLEFKDQENMPAYLYNGSGMVKYSVLAECSRLFKENYAGGCIFVDHLHYFAGNYHNVTQETSQIVRQIKQLAIQLDIPIVLLAHLHRDTSNSKKKGLYIPSMSDLKDTSTIEQDADQVIFVARDSESEDKKEREKVIIKLSKNRDGYAGRSVSMIFNEDVTAFVEVKGVDYEKEHKELEAKKKETVPEMDLPF